MSSRLYFDHNATCPLHPRIQQNWTEALQLWGNPSSVHWAGRSPKEVLRETRKQFADLLGVSPLELIFTSGASEGNATVFSMVESFAGSRTDVVISSVEHPSVQKSAAVLMQKGFHVHLIPVNRRGELDLEYLQKKLSPNTALVSVMAAHNETGVRFPIEKVSEMAKAVGARVHCDAVQSLGKFPVRLSEWKVDYATFSGHKFYALKGSGILYVNKESAFQPLIRGGGQERARRGGTENILGIWSLCQVLPDLFAIEDRYRWMLSNQGYLETELLKKISGIQITGAKAHRIPNTSSLVIENVDGESLLMALDLEGIAVSTGAACSSGSAEPSPSLLAMGLSRQEAQSSLRLSTGWFTQKSDIDQLVSRLEVVVERLRAVRTTDQGVTSC